MAEIIPFKGILYNQEKISDLSQVVAPPYDIISKEQQEKYYHFHPYNCIRLILGKDNSSDNEKNNKYTRAAEYFNTWLKEGVLKQDKTAALYPLIQHFSYHHKKITRRGFITLIRLEELGNGVFPHEKTSSKTKEDRLKLMLATKANFCQVFALYSDEEGVLDACLKVEGHPLIEIEDENKETHQLFRLTSKTKLEKIKEVMKSKPIFIADGHHRYETALNARNMINYPFIMIYLTKMEDEGLIILPTHRLICNIAVDIRIFEQYFEIKIVNNLWEKMKEVQEPAHIFGMYTQGKNYLLVLKDNHIMDKLIGDEKSNEFKQLDVSILETLIINHILKITDIESHLRYTSDEKEALSSVNEGKSDVAFLLNPTRISQLRQMALQHEMMPQKSTYFYPKLLTGLVMNKFMW